MGRKNFGDDTFWFQARTLAVVREAVTEIARLVEKAELPEHLERGLATLKGASML